MPNMHSTIKAFIVLSILSMLVSACSQITVTPIPDVTYDGWEIITPRPLKTLTNTPGSTYTATMTATKIIYTPIPPTPTPDPVCTEEKGAVRQVTFQSEILGKDYAFRVYVPRCYAFEGGATYPVLYLLHGLFYDSDQWDRLGIDETADTLIAAEEISPVIIVLPKEPDRTLDRPFFMDVMINELIPWVDANFATKPERAFRAIGGLSRGGALAIRLGTDNWKTFSTIGAHSPYIYDSDRRDLVNLLLDQSPQEQTRFFMDIGDRDQELPYAQMLVDDLTKANIPHTWYLFEGRHEEAYWASHLELYLRWYTEEW